MSGSSGAKVELGDTIAVKHGPRVREQREWLLAHAGPSLVRVTSGGHPDMLVMERLEPLRLDEYLDGGTMARTVVRLLRSVWSWPGPLVHFSLQDHLDKVYRLGMKFAVPHGDKIISTGQIGIDWERLQARPTHGDPTFENVMRQRQREGGLVLIDPIPATSAVPDLTCVDIGKILQSLSGWEILRYGDQVPSGREETIDQFIETYDTDDNERLAARYWHVVHLMRTLPYVTQGHQEMVKEMIDEYAGRL